MGVERRREEMKEETTRKWKGRQGEKQGKCLEEIK
jgi:hypothetical protein